MIKLIYSVDPRILLDLKRFEELSRQPRVWIHFVDDSDHITSRLILQCENESDQQSGTGILHLCFTFWLPIDWTLSLLLRFQYNDHFVRYRLIIQSNSLITITITNLRFQRTKILMLKEFLLIKFLRTKKWRFRKGR